MINIKNKVDCCGCNVCGDICPKNCITFNTDIEGFWYPEVDEDKCIDCHLCEKVCPNLNVEKLKRINSVEPKCLAANHKNLEIRFDSTSGGAFTGLVENFMRHGGYVGGAVYTDDWGVKQIVTNKLEDLARLRSSKYIQSDANGFYNQIKALLNSGENVLAVGLPCQMVALRHFLKKDYDNLIIIDLICRYVNSPKIYRKYLDYLERKYNSKVVYIKAKNKELGWKNLTHKVLFKNGSTYYGTFSIDKFMKASMMSNCLSRPSCYECKFKGFPRYADISLGDYWTSAKDKSYLDDNTGTSVIMVNSKKGETFFNANKKKFRYEDVSFESVLSGNPALTKSLPRESVDRAVFYNRMDKENFEDVVDSMCVSSVSKKQLIKNIIKLFKKELILSQLHFKPLWQFVYLNFIHPAVHGSLKDGFLIFTTPNCLFQIDKKADIQLHGQLTFGQSVFRRSKVETRIRMQAGSKMEIGNLGGNGYAFGYGSDIEIFTGGTLISKGGPSTNSFTTIICQDKIVIGQCTAIGRNVTIRDNNGHHQISINGYIDALPIIIGEHVWLCQGCTIMSGVKIGDGSIISANALVNRSFPSHIVAAGNPAKITLENISWKM